jgi:DNA-binding PadR family transcriptional regulator
MWLKGTERNARRILSEMERLGLVKVSGEEQSGNRGRPKKIYELQLDSKPTLHS